MTEAAAGRGSGSEERVRQVMEDHRKLMTVLHQLEKTADLREVALLAEKLQPLLERHFAHEEEPQGLFESVIAEQPKYSKEVSRLQEEHRTMLQEVEKIRAQAIACIKGPIAEVNQAVRGFSDRLRSHEAAENDLLTDSLYREDGIAD